ncbi:UDP-N-acetylmuramyl pentapeptide phosphotransferase/UDP-N-acetylglucosamine-1-phosphate transferase [Lutibacter oricola]|uniref:UDP-N-acetylmuramyl pentapeptide phosphotransferase/UDP-N-acetylglucosamine-1-phosphate transferase n=1 Tax=Lutibacter oricola TaxID=762486 RepID=A0A1H3FSS9_9FLAO|nr:glycosyltransferase family 4 protein [Lutibacter oricola]SDX93204.1 UDP-N-acetylmuramyl pentapeptide phosphotransferase/UDP-N-acetylglucosamine-1-phosphate transferase [Lutibacter oricola]
MMLPVLINALVVFIIVISSIIYLKLAQKYNIVDNPNFRSSHTIPTIRGGGILFFIAVLCYFVVSNFKAPYFVLGLSAIALISFLDDILTLSAKLRLPFQFLAVGLVLFQLHVFNMPWYVLTSAAIVGVAFVNVFNFMDGINGITGLYSLAVLGGLLALNTIEQLAYTQLLSYVLAAVVVFGYYNFRKKARMFAGDVGSISLAVVILYVLLAIGLELQAPVLILLVAVYGIDGGLTILYRFYLKEQLMQAHRHHLYQKLVDVWQWSHLKVSAVYMSLQLAAVVVVLLTYKFSILAQVGVVVAGLVMLAVLYVVGFKATVKKLEV